MFDQFPKKRPPLPRDIEEIYSAHYKSNREGETTASSLAQKMESWLHKQVAKDVTGVKTPGVRTLELGAGTLNQLQHEPVSDAYDIVEPFSDLYSDSPALGRLRHIYSDIAEVPAERSYDRITSIAVLEHICELPQAVARSGQLLAENGCFRAAIPNEGSLLWTLGWKLTTGLEFRLKYGQDYGLIMRHEHVNTAREIKEVLNYFFRDISCQVFGLSKSLSLYHYYECRSPQLVRCAEFSG